MARYRKVDPRIWNDEKFVALSDRAKLVFLLLLTHPHMTALGAMRATIPGMAAELNWTTEDFREAFAEVFRKALVEHDEKASYVCLPNFLKYNSPESPNVIKSWVSAVDLIPECKLKRLLLFRVKDFTEGLTKGFTEAFTKAFAEVFRKAMPNQEQEQEQEQEPKNPLSPPLEFLDYPEQFQKPPTAVLGIVPPNLDTPEFGKAWGEWVYHCIEKAKPVTPLQASKLLNKLARMGPSRAVEAIDHSITFGWGKILHPDETERGGTSAETPSARGKSNRSGRSIFDSVTLETLRDTAKLAAWHRRASAETDPVIGSTEIDKLNLVAAAEHAIERGENPVALFVSMVSTAKADGVWKTLTNADEDRARARLLEFRRQQSPSFHSEIDDLMDRIGTGGQKTGGAA